MLNPYGPVLPMMLNPHGQSLGTQRVLDQSSSQYFSPRNIKGRMAFDVGGNMLARSMRGGSSDSSPGDALAATALTYGVLTVGEKIGRWYNRRLQRLSERFPRFGHFRNGHPILGNALAWIPGAGLILTAGGVLAAAGIAAGRSSAVRSLLRHPTFKVAAPIVILGGALATSFWGITGRNALKNIRQGGSEYRELRKERPELSPAQLKQLNRATRNQTYLDHFQRVQAERRTRDLDPFYGVEPYVLASGK